VSLVAAVRFPACDENPIVRPSAVSAYSPSAAPPLANEPSAWTSTSSVVPLARSRTKSAICAGGAPGSSAPAGLLTKAAKRPSDDRPWDVGE
jgi:hypothetical protein